MNKLFQWLFGKLYQISANVYYPGGGDWIVGSQRFRTGGVFNSRERKRLVVATPATEPDINISLVIQEHNGERTFDLDRVGVVGSPDFLLDNVYINKAEVRHE